MITHRVHRPKGGDPVLTITIVGYNDIFRAAYNMLHQQMEFHAVGRKVMAYVARSLGRERFAAFDKSLTGGMVVKFGYQRQVRSER